MILYEVSRRSVFRNFSPIIRIRAHLNPILKHAKNIRIIKNRTITPKPNTSLIPKPRRTSRPPTKAKAL